MFNLAAKANRGAASVAIAALGFFPTIASADIHMALDRENGTIGATAIGSTCSRPNVDARLIWPGTFNIPGSYWVDLDALNTASMIADLDSSGKVLTVKTYRSSGDLFVDTQAAVAVKFSKFSPERKDCKAVPGSYVVLAEFTK
jgi:hypothetical protein